MLLLGKKLKSKLPEHVLEKISDYVEGMLKTADVKYEKDKHKFIVPRENIGFLMDAQRTATRVLIKKGIITKKMIDEDLREIDNG
jgi:hypothetical protein